ncbi:hypothetical protein AQUCO_01900197v1 [Aquilegia coerulea]|uniref:AB hydrolase-1 domain-containing protein n=1 Tax=Aquilegia coerulea TaxID=218851 RepID=A0A2G5DK43_AQUCA|nr:hypothetical protein AQUCO_01900197v1 [Aquilegia coerulea]
MSVAVMDDDGVGVGVGVGVGNGKLSTTSSLSWQEELASLVETSGIQYPLQYGGGNPLYQQDQDATITTTTITTPTEQVLFEFSKGVGGVDHHVVEESFKDQVKGFLKASAEMIQELGKGCKDVIQQSIATHPPPPFVTKFNGYCKKFSRRFRFLNDFLPEDRDPAHAWPVVFFVFIIALAMLGVCTEPRSLESMPKKVHIHPPSATLVQLPDGRHMAYHEQGVPADRARFSLVSPHSFLSSRFAGIPGIKESLLEEFGVRLITYDLPGFGESDPHPNRDLNTSAVDMLHLADAVGVNDKFWVVGYSGGGMHAWAALTYIPERLAGAAMFAPIVNPYDSSMSKEEKYKIWERWTPRRKLMYFLARTFPSLLTYSFSRSFLSGEHGQLEKFLSLSLGKKDKTWIEDPTFQEFWQRDLEESIRQGKIRPFIEEVVLQVTKWGFSLGNIQVQRKRHGKGFLPWLKSMYSQTELEWAGFLGPIHVWQTTKTSKNFGFWNSRNV